MNYTANIKTTYNANEYETDTTTYEYEVETIAEILDELIREFPIVGEISKIEIEILRGSEEDIVAQLTLNK